MSEEIIKQIALAFQAHGKELYLVGGTVRDELLGRESHDIDMATDAHPDEIKQIVAETEPLHIIPILHCDHMISTAKRIPLAIVTASRFCGFFTPA